LAWGLCLTPGGCRSEAERQKLGPASGVAIDESTKADLMGDSGAREPLGDDAEDNAEHGCSAIEELYTLELFEMDHLLSTILEPLVVSWSVCHGIEIKVGLESFSWLDPA